MPLFKRDRHQRIGLVLEALNGQLLYDRGCLFGGGTAIALRYGEYRESVDIDLVVSRLDGYRAIRSALTSADGIASILKDGAHLTLAREIRADQYGIRTTLDVGGTKIKFEIILEARVALDPPGPDDRICGIMTLTPLDMLTTKLLANSDRWVDDSVCARDLIDIAMMAPSPQLLAAAKQKAAKAYSLDVINRDLTKAKSSILANPDKLDRFMRAMEMRTPIEELQAAISQIDGPIKPTANTQPSHPAPKAFRP